MLLAPPIAGSNAVFFSVPFLVCVILHAFLDFVSLFYVLASLVALVDDEPVLFVSCCATDPFQGGA